jgi:hypothetical protein
MVPIKRKFIWRHESIGKDNFAYDSKEKAMGMMNVLRKHHSSANIHLTYHV